MRLALLSLPFLALAPFLTLTTALATDQAIDFVGRADYSSLANSHNKTQYASAMQAPGGGWHRPGKRCYGNPLRDPRNHCHCKSGLVETGDSCCCGDSKNTLLTLQGCDSGWGCNNPVCVCADPNAEYHNDTKECWCKAGYTPVRQPDGKLKCTKFTSPSNTPRNRKREIEDAVAARDDAGAGSTTDSNTLEAILQCRTGEKACKIGSDYVCTDISTDLASCGACPGEAHALPGVDEVRCEQGRCVIDSCQRGYSLEAAPTPVGTDSTLPASICKSKGSSPWLSFQRPGDTI